MAYITSEQVKEMREKIKAAFPAKDGWKWSVTKRDHSVVTAALMQFPAGYDFAIKRPEGSTGSELYTQLNHYHLDTCGLGKRETAVMKKVNEILHIGHWDKSDIMTDYHHCSHYVYLHIGKWDKPAVQAAPKVRKARKATNAPKETRKAAPAGSERDYLRIADFIGINY